MVEPITLLVMKLTNKAFEVVLLFGLGLCLASCYVPEKTFTKDFEETFSGINEIEVEGKFLEVSYEGKEGAQEVFLSAYLEAPESSGMDIRYRKSGSKLKIEVVGETSFSGWNFGDQFNGFISLVGPEEVKLNMVANSGSIDVMNVVHQKIDLKVNSGRIKAIALEVDEMNLSASSGSVKGEGMTGRIQCQVNSGQITFTDVVGDIEAKGSSGSMKFEEIEGNVNAKINSGSIRFNNVSSLGELSVSSGSIKAVDSGIGQFTSLNANSGSIIIQTNSDLSQFNYDLTANSGSVKVGEKSSGKSVEIDNQAQYTIKGKVSSGSIKINN